MTDIDELKKQIRNLKESLTNYLKVVGTKKYINGATKEEWLGEIEYYTHEIDNIVNSVKSELK